MKYILLFLLSLSLLANSYHIEDLKDTFQLSPKLITQLKKNNIHTTNDFLLINKTSKVRALNAKKYKIKIQKMAELISLFDLLRIKGVGPTVAKLFIASNIKSIRSFQNADIYKLEKKLMKVNKKLKISPFTPNVQNLDVWKNLSKKLEIIIL